MLLSSRTTLLKRWLLRNCLAVSARWVCIVLSAPLAFALALGKAIEWMADRSPATVVARRERMMVAIEDFDKRSRQSGACEAWFSSADLHTRKVAGKANGFLFETLLRASGYADVDCVNLLREGGFPASYHLLPLFLSLLAGAGMTGLLDCSGIGTPVGMKEIRSLHTLGAKCADHNARLFKALREDPHAEWLYKSVMDDARAWRMSEPEVWDGVDSVHLFHPRFAVSQLRPDGTEKLRAVDNFSWSPSCEGKVDSANGFTVVQEKMSHDTLDSLAEALALFMQHAGEVPALFKADVDSAYRRIPVKEDHRWVAGVAFMRGGIVFKSMHFACPFGAAASGNAWERIGTAIGHLATHFLFLAVLQYVDDFFGPERAATMSNAVDIFARLVRVLLGPDAIAEAKLECGRSLCILGVDLTMSRRGFQCRPAKGKIHRWIAAIDEALAPHGRLTPGMASKLAGKLSWGGAQLFHRLGRAMLRPIFDQKTKRNGAVCPELRRALSWWRDVLKSGIAELHPWQKASSDAVHMFCDAAGGKAHMGVVLFIGDDCMWTHMAVPRWALSRFQIRHDQQIMGLELLAISLGLSTFESILKGRRVVIHCDNSGSEVPVHSCVFLPRMCSFARYRSEEAPPARGITHSWCTSNGFTLHFATSAFTYCACQRN